MQKRNSEFSSQDSDDHNNSDLKGKFYQDFLEEATDLQNKVGTESENINNKEFMTMTMGNIKIQETMPNQKNTH